MLLSFDSHGRVGMTALYGLLPILLCFEFVSTSEYAFLYVSFCFDKAAAIFCVFRVTELDNFFWGWENFCRTFGPADWHFLSDILKKCLIVRQVRRISTALLLFQFCKFCQEHLVLSLTYQNLRTIKNRISECLTSIPPPPPLLSK